MLNKNIKTPLHIALYGMDSRGSRNMEMYLKGPCQGIAVVSSETDADVDIIDADHLNAQQIIETRKAATPARPIVLLSIHEMQLENMFFIKKPVTVAQIDETFDKIQRMYTPRKSFLHGVKSTQSKFGVRHTDSHSHRQELTAKKVTPTPVVNQSQPPEQLSMSAVQPAETRAKRQLEVELNAVSEPSADNKAALESTVPSIVSLLEHWQVDDVQAGVNDKLKEGHLVTESLKTAQETTPNQLDEKCFNAFIGFSAEVDFANPTKIHLAHYDRRHYYLAYVQSAYKTAEQKIRQMQAKLGYRPSFALRLNSNWRPLYLFPETREIWLDASENQLREFAGQKLSKNIIESITMTQLDQVDIKASLAAEKFQNIDTFLWKLTILASKGCFPMEMNLARPVYLNSWPDFTKLLITPDALRITALLMQGPRMPLDIAGILQTRPQYVFVFLSACHNLGILAQCEPNPHIDDRNALEKTNIKSRLLSKLLTKLHHA